MAEEEKEERRKKGFWRKVWEIFQTLGAGAGLLAFQHVLEETLKNFGKTAAEKAGDKVHEWFGLTPDCSGEGQEDNVAFNNAASTLEVHEKKKLRKFCNRLQKEQPKKFKQFTGRIALMTEYDAEKKTFRKRPPKGSNAPEEVTESKKRDYDAAKVYLKELLTYPGFDAKLAFLQGDGVFEEKEKKEAAGINLAKNAAEKVKTAAQKAATATVNQQDRNKNDLKETMANWRERSKAWRESR
jgi:hypothetical protein